MTTVDDLFELAEQEKITIDAFHLEAREALSVMDSDGHCFIAIDPLRVLCPGDYKTKLGHELGHCVLRAFYNRYSPVDSRGKCEATADRWSIRKMLPFEDMLEAMQSGYTEPWQLAEYFNVTENMIRKAYTYYTEACGLSFDE